MASVLRPGPRRQRAERSADLGFLFVGGLHQALHMAPVALALAHRPGVRVTAYVPPADTAGLRALLARFDPAAAARIVVTPLALPWWARGVRRLLGPGRGEKPLALIAWRRRLSRHDALVAAERTSTLLKRLPGRRPVLIHIPHGAGDRAGGFDPRIRLFDHVLVNGPFVRDRTVAEGLATPANITVIGSVKLAALAAAGDPPIPAAGHGQRPLVLYNPHFDAGLSSWPMAPALAAAIAADGRFDLIVAPHARVAERMDAAAFARWTDLAKTAGFRFDVTSPRLADMTYTRAAGLYLGDVSSQLYEFIARPRPAVFFNAHDVAWRDDPDYRMWTLGEVATTVPGVLAALGRARARHDEFRDLQAQTVAAVLGPVDAGVPGRAADALLAALDGLRGR